MNRFARIRRAYAEGTLKTALSIRARSLRYLVTNPAAGRVSLHTPPMRDPQVGDAGLVSRVLAAYRLMKRDQAARSSLYRPSSLWQQQLDSAYSFLGRRGDVELERAHFFLENFGNWDRYTGIAWSTRLKEAANAPLQRRHLENVFLSQAELWSWFYSGRKNLADLEHPRIGNQVGATVDGVFVTLQSFSAEVFSTHAMDLVHGLDRPIIAELGGGYGVLAEYMLREMPQACYIDFDLPETLTVAAYYLLKRFPEKKALLYGESPYSSTAHSDYDLILLPSFEMESIGRESVDIFLNTSSLGEMERPATDNYVRIMLQSTDMFFHENHDRIRNVFDDGGTSYVGPEYPVPPSEFRLLMRAPDLFHLTNRGYIDLEADMFMYFYGRWPKSR